MVNLLLNNIVNVIVESVAPQKVILFGSRSRRSYGKYSDYDLMVVKKGVKNERDTSRRIYKALYEKKIGQAVDVIVVDPKKLQRNGKNPNFIYSSVLKEGRIVYG